MNNTSNKQYMYNVTQNCNLPSQWFWHTVWKHHHTMSHTTATLVAMILLPLGGSCCLADPVIVQTFMTNMVQIFNVFIIFKYT